MSEGRPFWRSHGRGQFVLVGDDAAEIVSVDAAGDGAPIRLTSGDAIVEFDVPGDGILPPADEQFIRGETAMVLYPQNSERFAVRLAMQPIAVDGFDAGTILECRLSVQTDLLDSEPIMEVVCRGSGASVCLPPTDQAAGGERWVERSSLFGDFLEKGVIRQVQPWLIFGKCDDANVREGLMQAQQQREVALAD